jgi:hypothetical protein
LGPRTKFDECRSSTRIRIFDCSTVRACKAENVWTGFRGAKGDILMILDADLTVMPGGLPFFIRALVQKQR